LAWVSFVGQGRRPVADRPLPGLGRVDVLVRGHDRGPRAGAQRVGVVVVLVRPLPVEVHENPPYPIPGNPAPSISARRIGAKRGAVLPAGAGSVAWLRGFPLTVCRGPGQDGGSTGGPTEMLPDSVDVQSDGQGTAAGLRTSELRGWKSGSWARLLP